ncbi:MAG: hypothetical protein ACRER2_02590 [Methylococcales bacterium]
MRNTAYDYSGYEELFSDPQVPRVLGAIKAVAKKLGKIRWYVVGGSATFLHTRNPPEDEPDIDILIDAPVERAKRFVMALLNRHGFSQVIYDASEKDIFATLQYGTNGIKLDLFTSHEQPRGLATVTRRGVPLEPVEYLIIEKLIRPRWEDILMVIDLLARAKPNLPVLYRIAEQHGPEIVKRLLDTRKLFIMSMRVSADRIKREAQRLAERYELEG